MFTVPGISLHRDPGIRSSSVASTGTGSLILHCYSVDTLSFPRANAQSEKKQTTPPIPPHPPTPPKEENTPYSHLLRQNQGNNFHSIAEQGCENVQGMCKAWGERSLLDLFQHTSVCCQENKIHNNEQKKADEEKEEEIK